MRFLPRHARTLALLGLTSATLIAQPALAACPQLLTNSEFTSGSTSPWTLQLNNINTSGSYYVSTDQYKALHLDVYAALSGEDVTDVELSQPISIVSGQTYRISFWIDSDAAAHSIWIKVGKRTTPWTAYGIDAARAIPAAGGNITVEFTATATDADAGFVIFLGDRDAHVVIDSVFVEHISSAACDDPGGGGNGSTTGDVLVNQLGYLPGGDKIATVVSSSTTPLDWELLDSGGDAVATGETTYIHKDDISGDDVHLVDFSSYSDAGQGLRLKVGSQTSAAFDIGGDVFGALRRDALRFYYHQRSSSAISQPYAEGAQWVRASGHADTSVPCRTDIPCTYSLNISKGWYDAGDFGKYVVNGGIAAWTLMSLHERAEHLGTGNSPTADGTLNIPESANSRSDLLDEVRWQMNFLLGMQVPSGQPLAGMAHHKVHGDSWPGIPMAPSADPTGRGLAAPSTAATLNLAATAAQAARVFKTLDPTFSATCEAAAKAAYTAAKANPAIYATNTPNAGDEDGGGPYNDNDVTDEFYWAAAELYITTGESTYKTDLEASDHHATFSAMWWGGTSALGLASLAVVPNDLGASAVNSLRLALVGAADDYFAFAATGYGSPIENYGWGSNSDVLNAGIVLSLAYDLTGFTEYRSGALGTLDYVLGRNPLNQSYVTGYGETPFENAHHRIFANAYDSGSPKPPPGFIAGGPNKNLDGLANKGALAGCKGPKCWTDNEEAYGLTEVTVNWNAPLAWMAAWASELEEDPQTDFPGVDGAEPPEVPGGPRGAGPTQPGGGETGEGGAGSGSGSGSGASDGKGASTGMGGGDGDDSDGEDGGCGCHQGPSPSKTPAFFALGLIAVAYMRRRLAGG